MASLSRGLLPPIGPDFNPPDSVTTVDPSREEETLYYYECLDPETNKSVHIVLEDDYPAYQKRQARRGAGK